MKKTLLILILAALCLAGCQSLGARAPSPSAPAVTLRAQTPGPSGTPSLTPSPDAGAPRVPQPPCDRERAPLPRKQRGLPAHRRERAL